MSRNALSYRTTTMIDNVKYPVAHEVDNGSRYHKISTLAQEVIFADDVVFSKRTSHFAPPELNMSVRNRRHAAERLGICSLRREELM